MVLYRSLRRKVDKILKVAEEDRAKSTCGQVSNYLFTSGLAPAFQAIKKLSGKQRQQPPSYILSENGSPLEGPKAL